MHIDGTFFELTGDLINTIILFGLLFALIIAYVIRLVVVGRARFDRVDREGTGLLLKKGPMEMVYWSLQPFARLAVFFRVTPNMLSWACLVLGLAAGTCLAFGHFGFGAAFATVSALLDALDGMVARMTGRASDAGEVLDATVDRYSEFFFLGGLCVYYRDMSELVVLTLLALMGSFMVSYSTAKAEALQVKPPRGNMRRTERAIFMTVGAALAPISIPWFETPAYLNVPVPVGYPMVLAVGIIAVLANFSAIERLVAIAKAVRARENQAREQLKQAEALTEARQELEQIAGSDDAEAAPANATSRSPKV